MRKLLVFSYLFVGIINLACGKTDSDLENLKEEDSFVDRNRDALLPPLVVVVAAEAADEDDRDDRQDDRNDDARRHTDDGHDRHVRRRGGRWRRLWLVEELRVENIGDGGDGDGEDGRI